MDSTTPYFDGFEVTMCYTDFADSDSVTYYTENIEPNYID